MILQLRFLKVFCLTVSITVFGSSHLLSQIQTGNVPPGVLSYSFQNPDCNDQEHFLLTPFKSGNSGPISKPQIIDGNGDLVWFLRRSYPNTLNFRYFPNVNRYSFTVSIPQSQKTFILDDQMNLVDSVVPINASGDVHEFTIAANGNYIIATQYIDTVDLSGQYIDTIPGSSQTVLVGFGWQEITPAGALVFEWNSNEHLNPTESYTYYGYQVNHFDYCHGNAIAEDLDGNLIVSFRHMNALYKINRQTGAIIWKLGGNNSDFTFVNDAGFSGQHNVTVLGQDTISVFDDGNMSANQISRGVVYTINTNGGTVTKIHEIEHPNPFFAQAMGSYQFTEQMETVGYGLVYSPYPGLSVFDGNQNLKFELYLADSVFSYRALHKTAANWIRPEITCTNSNGEWRLEAPGGYVSYLWNTGETTASIPLTQPGTYQVWVNWGAGMIGSTPTTVTSVSNPCQALGLTTLANTIPIEFDYYDLLGRKVGQLESGKLYIRVYNQPGFKNELYYAP